MASCAAFSPAPHLPRARSQTKAMFERNMRDDFFVTSSTKLGELAAARVWIENPGLGDNWHLVGRQPPHQPEPLWPLHQPHTRSRELSQPAARRRPKRWPLDPCHKPLACMPPNQLQQPAPRTLPTYLPSIPPPSAGPPAGHALALAAHLAL